MNINTFEPDTNLIRDLAQFEQARQTVLRMLAEERQNPLKIELKKTALYRLSNEQYFVSQLYFYHGFEQEEIAEKANLPVSIVEALLNEKRRTIPSASFIDLLELYSAVTQGHVYSDVVFRSQHSAAACI